jgi:hypothetical protein
MPDGLLGSLFFGPKLVEKIACHSLFNVERPILSFMTSTPALDVRDGEETGGENEQG